MLSQNNNRIYRMSWVAYIHPCLIFAAVCLASFYLPKEFGYLVLLSLVWLVYKVVYIRRIKLFINIYGIWVTGGIFPWQRFGSGVRWHNVDEAITSNSFFAWLSKSYFVGVTNRYTKAIEISIDHIYKGADFVARLNHLIYLYHMNDNFDRWVRQNNQTDVASQTIFSE